jgi:GH25 family lysozyme M1 (1,4-beta-N-acetylmuramidase)
MVNLSDYEWNYECPICNSKFRPCKCGMMKPEKVDEEIQKFADELKKLIIDSKFECYHKLK